MGSVVQPGAIIEGKYRVLRLIGEGGMGTVYEGENLRIERRVAIKVLHEHVASSPEFAQRFEREARASARIGSPHVCDVLDLGDLENGERYIVMELLDGESLEDRLDKGKMTAADLAPFAFEILEGLGTMHHAGVVHRDLKPANIFLARRPGSKTEIVKILDFGVAKILPRADEPNEMTSTGMMMGTPLYMSPEQARGARNVDGRTDLYAASVIFYRALTGELPHSGLNLHELLFKIVLEDARPIGELAPEVDEAFAAIVTKGLSRDADERFSSARAYQEAIAAWGRAQGRASLSFAITLPIEPPPLRDLSGGYPVARAVSTTGPEDRVGPPTPSAVVMPINTVATGTAPKASANRPSGGTPTAWAEDAPEIAKRALADMEAKKRTGVTGGDTKVLFVSGATGASQPSGAMASEAPARPALLPPPSGKERLAAVAGLAAFLAVAAAGLGWAFTRTTPGTSATGSGSASVSAPTPLAEVAPSAPVPSEPTPSAEPVPSEPTPSAEPVSHGRTAQALTAPDAGLVTVSVVGKPGGPAVTNGRASTTNPVRPVPAPTTSTTASVPTAPTASHRKFRTNLD